MDSEDSGDNSRWDEDDEAIRIYQDYYPEEPSPDDLFEDETYYDNEESEGEDDNPYPSGSGPSPEDSPPLEEASTEKKYNGNLYGSDNESTNLAVEPTQKRYDRLEGDRREALNERVKDENKLRNKLGNALLWMVGAQLVVSDIFLSIFMCQNAHNQTIMLAWLSACVVEIIGIIWVITRSIFPFKDKYRDTEAEYMTRPGRMSQVSEVKTSQTMDAPQ